ncbi:LppU/SCO3897 family protein [Micromonospora cathayae]|uniref:LppU/SCO3897 family protein n=1 Tax=Micromonospora cathayae TaxID=3028804 RepID=UPI003C6D2FD3
MPAYLSSGRQEADPPPPTGRRRGRGRMVAVLGVLAVLVLGGGAALFYLAGSDGTEPVDALPSVTAAPSDTPPAQPDVPAGVSPSALAPESSADPRFAKVGQCVRNDAPAGARPKLLITGCAPKTYEVLRRFDGATSGEKDAEAKCARVEEYTDWYFYNSELDTLDFVLCLKLR